MDRPHIAELRKLLRRLDGEPAEAIESETLECKGWDPDPRERQRQVRAIREAVVCLANARGGTILLGVADRKRSRREAIQDAGNLDLLDLRRTIYDGTSPPILVEIEELAEPEGTILVLRVPRGLPPHTTSEGVAKIRVGRDCKPLTGSELVRLVSQGGQRDPTAETLPGGSLDDLEPEAVEILRRAIATEGGKPDLARRPVAELLEAVGLVRSGEVTLAAMLLLGRPASVVRWAPSHEVIFLHLRSATRYDFAARQN